MPKNERTGRTGQTKPRQIKQTKTKQPKKEKPKRRSASVPKRKPLVQRDPSPSAEPERTTTESSSLMDVDRPPVQTPPSSRPQQPLRRKRKMVIYSDDEDEAGDPQPVRDPAPVQTPPSGRPQQVVRRKRKLRIESDDEDEAADPRPVRDRGPGPELVTVHVPKVDLGMNARANRAFDERIAKPRKQMITASNYLSHLNKSVEDNRPVSYVVNIILPYDKAGDIIKVVDAIMAGSRGLDDRVAFVFGINSKFADRAELNRAFDDAVKAIAKDGRPIALVKETYRKKKFPHGTMRNGVLQSKATKEITAALYNEGTHPYISIQDFDDASRTVPSGEHVFNYFSDKLSGEGDSLPIRPMMLSGGYRPGSTTELPPAHDMEEDEFATHVSEDMLTRARLAEVHPLLPYSPEPNLYIDGTQLLAGYEGIQFGPGQAEFGLLSRGLNLRYADELVKLGGKSALEPSKAVVDLGMPEALWVGERDYNPSEVNIFGDPITKPMDPPSEVFFDPSKAENRKFLAPESLLDEGEDRAKRIQIDKRSYVQTFAETARHPVRGTPFLTDFIDGAIETDLTRVAKTLDDGWNNKVEGFPKHAMAQTHVPPKTAADRIFAVRDTATGTSLVNYGRKPHTPEPLRIRVVPESQVKKVEETGWGIAPQTVNSYFMRRSVPGTPQIWTPTDPTSKTELGASPFVGNRTETQEERIVKRGKKEVLETVPVVRGKGVPGKLYDRQGPITSTELRKPYARIYASIPPSQTAIAMHGVALSNPTRDTLYKLRLLKTQVLAKDVLSGETVPSTRAPVADNSLYAAAAASMSPPITAARLRDLVIDTAITKLTAEEKDSILARQPITSFIVDNQMGSGDLTVALTQHSTWVVPRKYDELFSGTIGDFRPGDTERAQNAHVLAMRLVATHLKRELHIYREGLDRPLVYTPFSAPPTGKKPAPIRLNETVGTNDEAQETRTFSLRK